MLVKTIKYKDYNDNEREEDFYFNLRQDEMVKMQFGTLGGLDEALKKIMKSENTPEIFNFFEKLILTAYGEKSLDGKYFNKSEELSKQFQCTEAYNILFMELIKDPKNIEEFLLGCFPSELSSQVEEQIKENGELDLSVLDKK